MEAARVEAGEEAAAPRLNCFFLDSNEPDFLEQKEWLTTVVEAVGFTIMFFPKYHCEFNFIEMIWGWCKSHHRRTCTYNYNDLIFFANYPFKDDAPCFCNKGCKVLFALYEWLPSGSLWTST